MPITSLPKLDNLEGSTEGGSANGTVLIVMTVAMSDDEDSPVPSVSGWLIDSEAFLSLQYLVRAQVSGALPTY